MGFTAKLMISFILFLILIAFLSFILFGVYIGFQVTGVLFLIGVFVGGLIAMARGEMINPHKHLGDYIPVS